MSKALPPESVPVANRVTDSDRARAAINLLEHERDQIDRMLSRAPPEQSESLDKINDFLMDRYITLGVISGLLLNSVDMGSHRVAQAIKPITFACRARSVGGGMVSAVLFVDSEQFWQSAEVFGSHQKGIDAALAQAELLGKFAHAYGLPIHPEPPTVL